MTHEQIRDTLKRYKEYKMENDDLYIICRQLLDEREEMRMRIALLDSYRFHFDLKEEDIGEFKRFFAFGLSGNKTFHVLRELTKKEIELSKGEIEGWGKRDAVSKLIDGMVFDEKI